MRRGFIERYLHRHHIDCLDMALTFAKNGNEEMTQHYMRVAIRDRWGKKVSRAISEALILDSKPNEVVAEESINDLLRDSWSRFPVNDFENTHCALVLNEVMKLLHGEEYDDPVIAQFIFNILAAKRLDALDLSQIKFDVDSNGNLINVQDPDLDNFQDFIDKQTPFHGLLNGQIEDVRASRLEAMKEEDRFIHAYRNHAGKTSVSIGSRSPSLANTPIRDISINEASAADLVGPVLIRELFGK